MKHPMSPHISQRTRDATIAFRVNTSHGAISLQAVGEGPLTAVFIHGNSWCSEVFKRQFASSLAGRGRLVSIDLPGHGLSGNALDPVRTYTRPGLADACVEALSRIDANHAVLVGWSLGGHIAVEMLSRYPGARALALIGTPPVPAGGMTLGFKAGAHLGLAGQADFSGADTRRFAHATLGGNVGSSLLAAIQRTDSRFRPRLFEGMREGLGIDQKEAVERCDVPIAVVNGSLDPVVNLEYFDSLRFRRLWKGKCHRIANAAHAPFWDSPDAFNVLIGNFFDDVEKETV
jgi:pimeloyl-ACP methyl ester carboxylesterase